MAVCAHDVALGDFFAQPLLSDSDAGRAANREALLPTDMMKVEHDGVFLPAVHAPIGLCRPSDFTETTDERALLHPLALGIVALPPQLLAAKADSTTRSAVTLPGAWSMHDGDLHAMTFFAHRHMRILRDCADALCA